MANIKSAIKRIKTTKRNTLQNKLYRSNIKTFTRKYLISLNEYNLSPNASNLALVTKYLSVVFSKIDKAVKKNVLHRNTAARKKRALANAFNSIQ